MSLVKKLQTGGQISPDLLNQELENQLSQLQLKTKDERAVRNAVAQIRDYMAVPDGKSFTVDPVTQTYKITGPGSEALAGSSDVKRNWFTGNYKVQDDPKNAMSIAALAYHNAVTKLKGSTPSTTTKPAVTITGIGNFLSKDMYGSEENYDSKWSKLLTDEDRKKEVLSAASQHIGNYITEAEKNKENLNFADLEDVQNAKKAAEAGDWNSFKDFSKKLNWNIDTYLLSEDDKENIAKINAQKAETDKVAQSTSMYDKLNLPANVRSALSTTYTEERPDWVPEGINQDWFKNLMEENKARILYNPTANSHFIIKSTGEPFNYTQNTNQLSPSYGYSFVTDATGTKVLKPEETIKYQDLVGEDTLNRNIGRDVITDLPGKVLGWSEEKDGIYNKDILGKRDFTKYLVQIDDNGIKTTWRKQPDGTYKNDAEDIKSINIKGFGTENTMIEDYEPILNDPTSPLSVFKEQNPYKNNLVLFRNTLANVKETIQKENRIPPIDTMNGLASQANYNLRNAKSIEERRRALEDYNQLRQIFTENSIAVLPQFKKFKSGGVIQKGQKGMTIQEYNKKYGSPTTSKSTTSTTSATTEKPRPKAISSEGRLGSMNALEGISLVGSAASFFPVVGAIGGAVTTVADIANDIQKDGFQASDIFNWNTAANVGFTALSAVGLGSLRGLQLAAKTAKVAGKITKAADIGRDISKASGKLAKLTIEGVDNPIVKSAKNIIELKGLGVSDDMIKTISEVDNIKDLDLIPEAKSLLKSANYIDDAGNVLSAGEGVKHIETGLQAVKSIAKSTSNPIARYGKTRAEAVVRGAKIVGEKLSNANIGKWTDRGFQAAGYGYGAKGAVGMIKTYNESPENLTFTQKLGRISTSDLLSTVQGASLLRNRLVAGRQLRAMNAQTDVVSIPESKKIIVNGKSYDVTADINTKPNIKTSIKDKGKELYSGKTEDKVKEEVEHYRKELEAKLPDSPDKEKNILEILGDQKSAPKIRNKTIPAQEGARTLKPEVANVYSDQYRNAKHYEIAKKVIERGITNPGQFWKYWGKSSKTAKLTPLETNITPKNSSILKESTNPITSPKLNVKNKIETPKVTETTIEKPKSKKPKEVTPKVTTPRKRSTKPKVEKKELGGIIKAQNGVKLYSNKLNFKPNISLTSNKTGFQLFSDNLASKLNKSFLATPSVNTTPTTTATGGLPKTGTYGFKDITKFLNLKSLVDPTDIANTLMYINTTQANKSIGNAQATANSIYSLPMMQKQNVRITNPYISMGAEETARLTSAAGNVANATSDIDRGNAVRLEGQKQASEARMKYNLAGVERLDKLRQMQDESTYKTNMANAEISERNKAIFADAAKKMSLVRANETNANSTAFNNFVISAAHNLPVKKYKQTSQELYKKTQDPLFKGVINDYSKAVSDESRQTFVDQYNAMKISSPSFAAKYLTFEGSDYEKAYIEKAKRAREKVEPFTTDLQSLKDKASMQYNLLQFIKKGGTLSKEDRIELEERKAALKRSEKNTERISKTILHNNEMLQKSLIKIFK